MPAAKKRAKPGTDVEGLRRGPKGARPVGGGYVARLTLPRALDHGGTLIIKYGGVGMRTDAETQPVARAVPSCKYLARASVAGIPKEAKAVVCLSYTWSGPRRPFSKEHIGSVPQAST